MSFAVEKVIYSESFLSTSRHTTWSDSNPQKYPWSWLTEASQKGWSFWSTSLLRHTTQSQSIVKEASQKRLKLQKCIQVPTWSNSEGSGLNFLKTFPTFLGRFLQYFLANFATFFGRTFLGRTLQRISRSNFAAIFPGRCILLWEFIADILISIAFCNIPGRILQQFLGWTLQNFPRSSFATFADRICEIF